MNASKGAFLGPGHVALLSSPGLLSSIPDRSIANDLLFLEVDTAFWGPLVSSES